MFPVSRVVVLSAVLELLVFLGAWLLAVRPRFLFGAKARDPDSWKESLVRGLGTISAVLLFCWSLIFGAILMLHGVVLRV